MKLRQVFLYVFLSLTILYACVCTYMYIFQRNFLYLPGQNNNLRGEKLNLEIKEISVPSTENITLKAWFYNNPKNKYTVLFFHGNAGGLEKRIYKLNEFKNLNLNYLIISWRGFSGNTGIILESPYTSIVDAAKIYYPYLPVDLILKDKYLSLKKIKNINSPILIMHGGADIIIPIAMGKKLFDEVQSKKYGYFPQFDRHMMTYNSELKLELQKFIKTLN